MMTVRDALIRTTAAAAILAVAPSTTLAHPGEGPAGMVHDLLHGFLLDPTHAVRPVALLLVLVGGGIVGAGAADRSERRTALRVLGSSVVLAGAAALALA